MVTFQYGLIIITDNNTFRLSHSINKQTFLRTKSENFVDFKITISSLRSQCNAMAILYEVVFNPFAMRREI